jgi:hypothetical protein
MNACRRNTRGTVMRNFILVILIFIIGNVQIYIYNENAFSYNWEFKTVSRGLRPWSYYHIVVYIHITGDRHGSNCTTQLSNYSIVSQVNW